MSAETLNRQVPFDTNNKHVKISLFSDSSEQMNELKRLLPLLDVNSFSDFFYYCNHNGFPCCIDSELTLNGYYYDIRIARSVTASFEQLSDFVYMYDESSPTFYDYSFWHYNYSYIEFHCASDICACLYHPHRCDAHGASPLIYGDDIIIPTL